MSANSEPAVWFPAVRAGSGTDVFTERMVAGLRKRGLRAGITWLPLRAEYAPWTVPVPVRPSWANVVHVNTWLHPRLLPEHLPVIATLHHSVHHSSLESYKGLPRRLYHRWWIRAVERQVLRRANAVVAVSQFAADTACETLFNRPMQVIYNGIDTECFRPPAQRSPHSPFRLLYVGSWVTRKGVDLLAPIMRELGEGFELRYTGGQAAERDKKELPANMRDIGRLRGDSSVIAAMSDVDVLLFPSRNEGFGLVVAEAMACGLAVVATRGSSLVEVVEDGVTGLLCPQDNVMAFVRAVRELAADSNRWRAMADAARVRSVAHFSFQEMVDAYIRIYQEITCV